MFNWQRYKNRIFVKLAALIMAQVFFIASLGYARHERYIPSSYINGGNLRVPVGQSKGRVKVIEEKMKLDRIRDKDAMGKRIDGKDNSLSLANIRTKFGALCESKRYHRRERQLLTDDRHITPDVFLRSAHPYWEDDPVFLLLKLKLLKELTSELKPQKANKYKKTNYFIENDKSPSFKPITPSRGEEPLVLKEVVTSAVGKLQERNLFFQLIDGIKLGRDIAVIGLGNGGINFRQEGFETTPHNLGYMTIEVLAQYFGVQLKDYPDLHCKIARVQLGKGTLSLVQPQSDINYCGGPTREALAYLGDPKCVVIADDIKMSLGGMRLAEPGIGHKGVQSIWQYCGDQIPVFCIGADIGWRSKLGTENKVLQQYPKSTQDLIGTMLSLTSVAVLGAVSEERKATFESKVENLERNLKQPQIDYIDAVLCHRYGDTVRKLDSSSHLQLFEMLPIFWKQQWENPEQAESVIAEEVFGVVLGFLEDSGLDRSKLQITILRPSEVEPHPNFPDPNVLYKAWVRAGISPEQIIWKGADENLWKEGGSFGRPGLGNDGKSGWCSGLSTEIFDATGNEIANFILPRFIKLENGEQISFPFQEIDVVVGLDRLRRAVQGVPSLFDIDTLAPLVSAVRNAVPVESSRTMPADELERLVKIIADDLRAVVFLVADGASIPPKAEELQRDNIFKTLLNEILTTMTFLGIDRKKQLRGLLKVATASYVERYPEVSDPSNFDRVEQLFDRLQNQQKIVIRAFIGQQGKPGLLRRLRDENSDLIFTEEDYQRFERFGIPGKNFKAASEFIRLCVKQSKRGKVDIYAEDFLILVRLLNVDYQELKQAMKRELKITIVRDKSDASIDSSKVFLLIQDLEEQKFVRLPLLTIDKFFGKGASTLTNIGRNAGPIGLAAASVLYESHPGARALLVGSGRLEPAETANQVPVVDNQVIVEVIDRDPGVIADVRRMLTEKQIPLAEILGYSKSDLIDSSVLDPRAHILRRLNIQGIRIEAGNFTIDQNTAQRILVRDPIDIRDAIGSVDSRSIPLVIFCNVLNNVIHQEGFDWEESSRLYREIERILATRGMMVFTSCEVYFHWYKNHEEEADAPAAKDIKNIIQTLEEAGLEILFKSTMEVDEYAGGIMENTALITARNGDYDAFPDAEETVKISREQLIAKLPGDMKLIERKTTFEEFKAILSSGKESNLVLIKVARDQYVSFNIEGRFKDSFTKLALAKPKAGLSKPGIYFGIQDVLAESKIERAHNKYKADKLIEGEFTLGAKHSTRIAN